MRLGKVDSTRTRPLKVILATEDDKLKVMGNLKKLKDKVNFASVSVTEDYTIAEREAIKIKTEEVKVKNAAEPVDSKFVYRLRGSPKNGLEIKKFPKRV